MLMFLDFDGVLRPQYDGEPTPADRVFCHLPSFEAIIRTFLRSKSSSAPRGDTSLRLTNCARGFRRTSPFASSARHRKRSTSKENSSPHVERAKSWAGSLPLGAKVHRGLPLTMRYASSRNTATSLWPALGISGWTTQQNRSYGPRWPGGRKSITRFYGKIF